MRQLVWWWMDHDPILRWMIGIWSHATADGIIVGLIYGLAVCLVFEAGVQSLWWAALRPLIRRGRARKAAARVSAPTEPARAPEADLVPQFGIPSTLLFNPVEHGPFLACASGVKCGRAQFAEGEAFFKIADQTEHHPMVAVCTKDVVLRDGALDGRAWTDEPPEPLESATVYRAPRAGRR